MLQNNLKSGIYSVLFILFIIPASAIQAEGQQTATVRATEAGEERPALRLKVQGDTALSEAFQNAMEAGDRRAALRACGSACKAGGAGSLTSAADAPRYTCNSGNCACAGAADCVAMAPHCQEGTIGCNDYGCTCKEGEGD